MLKRVTASPGRLWDSSGNSPTGNSCWCTGMWIALLCKGYARGTRYAPTSGTNTETHLIKMQRTTQNGCLFHNIWTMEIHLANLFRKLWIVFHEFLLLWFKCSDSCSDLKTQDENRSQMERDGRRHRMFLFKWRERWRKTQVVPV